MRLYKREHNGSQNSMCKKQHPRAVFSHFILFILLTALLFGCDSGVPTNPTLDTSFSIEGTVEVENTPIIVVSEEPESQLEELENTLIICVADDPGMYFVPVEWGTSKELIYQALYDGGSLGYDLLEFSNKAVILEKLPNLNDGDAFIEIVTVEEGDWIMLDSFTVTELNAPHAKEAKDGDIAINAAGQKVMVEFGMSDWIRPTGCNSADCAVPYVGNVVMIDQQGTYYRPAGCRDESCKVEYLGGEVEMEQLVVYYSFRPDLVWSDGTPVTAEDSVYGFQLSNIAATDNNLNQYLYNRIQSYVAIDDFTIEMKTTPGYLGSTYPTTFWVPLPEHVWSEYSYSELEAGMYLKNMLSFGPYVFEDYSPGKNLILTKNPYYFRADEGLPYFDIVVYRFVGVDAGVNSASLISGECDILDSSTLLEDRTEFLMALANTGMIKAQFVTSSVWEHLDFGIFHSDYDDGFSSEEDRPDYFSDVRTRQGIAYCINRQEIIDELFFGQSVVLNSYIPSVHPLYNQEIEEYELDIAKGASLLAEAGWIYGSDGFRYANGVEGVPDGTRLELSLYTTAASLRQNISSMIEKDLAECGVDVKTALMSPGELFDISNDSVMFGRNFDLAEFAWWTDVEPPCDLFLSGAIPSDMNNWEGYNITGYINPEYDLACTTALSSIPGEAEYEYYHKLAQKIFSEDLPVFPLFQRLKLAATRVDLCGFQLDASASVSIWNIEEFYLGEDCK